MECQKCHKTARGGGYRGSATGEVQWPIGPRTAGQGITARPPQTLLDNRSTMRADGRAKRRAAAGSPAPWRTCQNTGWERNEGTRSPTGPWTPGKGNPQGQCQMRTDDRLLQRQTEEPAFALPGHCSGITTVSSAQRQKHLAPLPPTT